MNTTVDDTSALFTYSTNPPWNTNVWAQQNPQPLYGTNHGTPNPGATATLRFNGTAVYVYGYKWLDQYVASGEAWRYASDDINFIYSGYRDIVLDGRPTLRCDGRSGQQGSQALVYWAEGLDPGVHEVSFRHAGILNQYLNLDYVLITNDDSPYPSDSNSDYPNPTNSGSPTPTNGSSNVPTGGGSRTTSKTNTTAIVVGVVVGVALVAIVLFILWLWRRRKASKQNTPMHYHDKHQSVSPSNHHHAHEATPFILPQSPPSANNTNLGRESLLADKPNTMFVANAGNSRPSAYSHPRPPAPSSGYYSTSDAASAVGTSAYSPPPSQSAYSPPPSQHLAPVQVPAPLTVTNVNNAGLERANTVYAPDPNNPHPWASSSTSNSVISSSVNPATVTSAGGEKARYAGPNTSNYGGASSAPHPMRNSSLEAPPPEYTI
ncbi:hypothetical protein FRC17_007255 [Serendipita sp. 399]|nr:hypothetical protein FRC17_007255 [Serendipita sp. 399]